MHHSLVSEVASGLQEASSDPLLPETAIKILGDKTSGSGYLLLPLAKRKLSIIPWFVEDSNGELTTPLSSVFGVFVIRALLRGFFIGASFLPGTDLLLEKRYLTLSVIGYYTAALHLVNSFNSLQGRVFITPVAGQPIVEIPSDSKPVNLTTGGTISNTGSVGYSPSPRGLQAVCAILSRHGKWVFEGRGRTHSAYWRELRQWVTESNIVPHWLDEFCRGCVYPTAKVSQSEYLKDGFEQLVEARHQAIYGGFGMDDWAFDRIINREDIYANVAIRAQNYKMLAYGILRDILSDTTELFTRLEKKCPQELKSLLPEICTMVSIPPFDLRSDFSDAIHSEVTNVPGCEDWLSRILQVM